VTNDQVAASQDASIYFAPQQDVALVDIGLIRHSRKSIQVVMYAFTDRRIAEALVDACRQGVDISIYRDHGQYEQEERGNSRVHQILKQCQGIHVRVKGSGDLMHEKAALFDDATLRDGSGNWSISAAHYQDNEISITRQQEEVDAFQRDFAGMWQRSDNVIIQ
jgi:phosphatidylserine/phosphatidylglycerophosphate/cardiolipin synthase-like enzyme